MLTLKQPKSYGGFKDRFCKYFTLVLFFCLPRKVTVLFVELSVSILLLRLRDHRKDGFVETDKLNLLLGKNYDSGFVGLPEYTVKWFWTDDYLNSVINLRTGETTIKEALVTDSILKANYDTVTSKLIDNLPYLIKLKLNLFKGNGRMKLKHRLVNLFHNEMVLV